MADRAEAIAGHFASDRGIGGWIERSGFHPVVSAVSGAGGGNGPVEQGGLAPGGGVGVDQWR